MPRSILSSPLAFLLVGLVALCFLPGAAAFGAGNIPSFSYLEDKAFRHGDIEDILEKIAKASGGAFLGFGAGKKFSPLDVKRVYFGNWLRDYSQAVDVGALKKVPLQTIMNIVMALGFLAHGYATAEFEVTKDRLGCYLPTEHIDNPKGYGEGEDARKYDSRLRGPVDPRELEVDPRTGMKNYIANENGGWDTSKALVRRVLEACIHFGRQAKATGSEKDEYEAFRFLGQAMHTLEDFTAHSNWCELALQQMGHKQVFAHVGRNATVRASNGEQVPILVTGTFGGSDFLHSLIGESSDHLSSASVSDLNAKVAGARSMPNSGGTDSMLRQLLFDLPGNAGSDLSREMDSVTAMRAGQPGGIDPSQMSPQELHDTLWKILAFRDSVMKSIENTIEKIPGLGALITKLTDSVNVFIFTTLEPYLKPLLGTATEALGQASAEVINQHDQYEVFNNPNASDPTHSLLSKDHFNLILNEPAGKVAQVIVEYTVERVVKAWNDPNMHPNDVTGDILNCLFHPYFHNQQSTIQRLMLEKLRAWYNGEGSNQREVLNRLTMDSVRNHKNIRIGNSSGHMTSALGNHGLQGALAEHNVHVPGAQVLNAGQDLMSGKMPWQQGFGNGGPNRWREMDPNAVEPAQSGQASGFYGGQGDSQQGSHPPPQQYQQPSQQYQSGSGSQQYQQAPQQYQDSDHQYQQPQQQYSAPPAQDHQSYQSEPYQGQHQGHSQGGYNGGFSGPPQGPPPDQFGQYSQYDQPPQQQFGQYQQPPPQQHYGGHGPPHGQYQQHGGPPPPRDYYTG